MHDSSVLESDVERSEQHIVSSDRMFLGTATGALVLPKMSIVHPANGRTKSMSYVTEVSIVCPASGGFGAMFSVAGVNCSASDWPF